MSNIKKCLLIFMNFWIIHCKINSTNIESSDNSSLSCIMTKNHTNSVWQLVWQDQFESESDFSAKWNVHNEHILCKNSESCNRRDNVYLSDGYLVLQAKQKRYLQYNYTGGRLTSKHAFAEGRYEIRATQPNGLLIRACFYAFNQKMYKERGKLEIMCYQQGLQGNRAIVKGKMDETFHHFHTYGVEWREKNVIFFFDDLYTEPIMLNASFPPNKKYHLRLEVTIEKSKTKSTVEDFDKMSWRCPAFIVDHVRVYQNVANRSDLPECKKQQITKSVDQEQEILNQICLSSLAKSLIDDSDNSKMSFTTLLGIILLAILLFIVLVSFLFAKYSRMRNKNQERVQNMVQYFIGDIANNKSNYEVPKYDYQGRYSKKKRSYLDLQDGDIVSGGSCQESVLKS